MRALLSLSLVLAIAVFAQAPKLVDAHVHHNGDAAFLQKLVERLERSVSWSITITEGNFYLNIGDETLEAAIRKLA